ncbi:MAG: putative ATP-dependent endonuclease of OLD family [Nonlabens sp.]|jgi:putative ATP-dependent endonuclease of OLD family
MHISKIHITNFKGYENFDLSLDGGINILVGDNESKKSSVLEAINLVLTGHIDSQFLTVERLNPYLFNKSVTDDYVRAIKLGHMVDPPAIRIELFFPDEIKLPEAYEGMNNHLGEKHKGVYYEIAFNEMHRDSYTELISTNSDMVASIPLEYFKIRIVPFSGNEILRQSLPIKSVLLDVTSSSINVNETVITKIIKNDLSTEEILQAKQFHRGIKDEYKKHDVHDLISGRIPNDDTTASIDPSAKNSWDSHLSIFYKEIPFTYIGKGRQSMMKTRVALNSNKATEARVILVEEPENHLSHSNLVILLREIEEDIGDKQVIVTSHSSFVSNKLGVHNLKLLSEGSPISYADLDTDTENFFKKLPGYDTLRLLLCKRAILVEGDADELVIQRAYMDKNNRLLPLMEGIEVISVNNTYKRFVELGLKMKKKIAVAVDADNREVALQAYKETVVSTSSGNIDTFFECNDLYEGIDIDNFNKNTLEPLLLKYNGLEVLNLVLEKEFESDIAILKYMRNNKTKVALKIFESETSLTYPKYIVDAITHIS